MFGAAQFGSYGLGDRLRLGVEAIGSEPAGLAIATGEAKQQGLGSGSGAVVNGEAQALIGSADQVTCGVVPGVEIGATSEGLAEVTA